MDKIEILEVISSEAPKIEGFLHVFFSPSFPPSLSGWEN